MKTEKQSNTSVDDDIKELGNTLGEAKQLLRDMDGKPMPFIVELIGTIVLAVAIILVAFALHHFLPVVIAEDLLFWAFLIIAVPLIILLFIIATKLKRRIKREQTH